MNDDRDAIRGERIHVFKPRPAVRMQGGGFGGGDDEGGGGSALGKNPPTGVVVSYTLKDKLGDKEVLIVEFLDGDRALRSFTSQKKPEAAPGADEEEGDKPIEPKAGMNRLVWDMRIVKPSLLPKAIIWGNSQGPKVGPGTYAVRFKLGDQTITQPVEVRAHPGVPTSAADLKKQYDLLRSVRDRISETHDTVLYIRDVKAQATLIGDRAEKLGKGNALKDDAKAMNEKLTAIEKKLVNPDVKSNQDVLNFPPALDHQFVGIATVVASADTAPTDTSYIYLQELENKMAAIQGELKAVLDKDLAAFNKAVRDADIPPVAAARKKAG